jgi:glycosyltransferase involved in cell wall biosynthesis
MSPRPHRPDGEKLRILHVGNIHPVKGLDVLLTALSGMADVPFRLEVAGAVADERFRRSLDDLMNDALRGRVIFLGAVPAERMNELYRSADMLAVPSRYEGFGIALLEAMGSGIPVIAGREGGAKELVSHGRDGFLVPPGDHEAVARYVRALSDDALRDDMGRAARRRWEEHPTWEESLERAVDLIERMAADPGQRRQKGGSPSWGANEV